MFLPLLQMLLVPWPGNAEQRAEARAEAGGIPRPLPEDGDAPAGGGPFMARLLAGMGSGPRPDPGRRLPASTRSPLLHPHRRRETRPPLRRDARRFWELFTLKSKSRSEEMVLPIKSGELGREVCDTVPFAQSIVHEMCEKLEVQNNLCFGRCSSFHVPGPEDRIYTFCSHCSPIKFSVRRLEMNCTMATPVIKLVMIVEECKCMIQKAKNPVSGFLHPDLQAEDYDHS